MSDGETKSAGLFGLFKRWFDKEPKTSEDLLTRIQSAFQQQSIDVDTWRMLQGVMTLSNQRVRDIMVPRAQILMLNEKDTLEASLRLVIDSQHSRFPVTGDNKDSLVGILMTKDLLTAYIKDQVPTLENLKPLLRPVFYVPEMKKATELLREFQSRHLHMAVAVDEYGNITGLVTIEDIIEAIVGEIEDEYDTADVHILQMKEDTFTVKAVTPVAEVNRFFDIELDIDAADTIGGLVVARFGRVPQTGETMVIGNLSFKVLRADRRRVQLFKVVVIRDEDMVQEDA